LTIYPACGIIKGELQLQLLGRSSFYKIQLSAKSSSWGILYRGKFGRRKICARIKF
jgi:hypothetical protein